MTPLSCGQTVSHGGHESWLPSTSVVLVVGDTADRHG